MPNFLRGSRYPTDGGRVHYEMPKLRTAQDYRAYIRKRYADWQGRTAVSPRALAPAGTKGRRR